VRVWRSRVNQKKEEAVQASGGALGTWLRGESRRSRLTVVYLSLNLFIYSNFLNAGIIDVFR
jgi:hypothetical protein